MANNLGSQHKKRWRNKRGGYVGQFLVCDFILVRLWVPCTLLSEIHAGK